MGKKKITIISSTILFIETCVHVFIWNIYGKKVRHVLIAMTRSWRICISALRSLGLLTVNYRGKLKYLTLNKQIFFPKKMSTYLPAVYISAHQKRSYHGSKHYEP